MSPRARRAQAAPAAEAASVKLAAGLWVLLATPDLPQLDGKQAEVVHVGEGVPYPVLVSVPGFGDMDVAFEEIGAVLP